MNTYRLYDLLDEAGLSYEIVEMFDGYRVISIKVDEMTDAELNAEVGETGEVLP
jgi:hypothetical protein